MAVMGGDLPVVDAQELPAHQGLQLALGSDIPGSGRGGTTVRSDAQLLLTEAHTKASLAHVACGHYYVLLPSSKDLETSCQRLVQTNCRSKMALWFSPSIIFTRTIWHSFCSCTSTENWFPSFRSRRLLAMRATVNGLPPFCRRPMSGSILFSELSQKTGMWYRSETGDSSSCWKKLKMR